MIFWPSDLSAVYAPAIKSGFDIEVGLSALVLALIIALGIFLYHRRRDLLFWLVLFFIGLLPVSQIVPIVTLMNDRYLYFPMLGAAAFIAGVVFLAIDKEQKTRPLVRVGAGMTLLLLLGHDLVVTYDRIRSGRMKPPCGRMRSGKFPNHQRLSSPMPISWSFKERLEEAEKQYELGLTLSPEAFERYSLARLYEKNGQLDKAKEEYQRFLLQSPGFLDARNSLALIYFNEGMLDQAIEQYKTALQYDPAWARGYNNLAVIYTKRGNRDSAIKNIDKAVSLDPGNAEFHFNLGNVLFENGSKEKALRELELAANLDPRKPLYAIRFAEVSEMVKGKS